MKKYKPKIVFIVRPKKDVDTFFADDIFFTKKEALIRKKDYVKASQMEIVKMKLIELK